jgi:hypothetical protein
MSKESQTFAFGSAIYPLDGYSSNSLLRDADFPIYITLEFFKSVLDTYLLQRWTAEATTAGLTTISSSLVGSKLPYDPFVFNLEESFKFPILSVFRTTEDFTEHSIQYYQGSSVWKALWILPPLSPAQYERLQPILKGVSDTLKNRTEIGFDGYYNSGEQVWKTCNVASISVANRAFGNIPNDKTSLYFPTVAMDINVTETKLPVSGAFDNLTGTDINEDLADSQASTLADVVDFKTNQ